MVEHLKKEDILVESVKINISKCYTVIEKAKNKKV